MTSILLSIFDTEKNLRIDCELHNSLFFAKFNDRKNGVLEASKSCVVFALFVVLQNNG